MVKLIQSTIAAEKKPNIAVALLGDVNQNMDIPINQMLDHYQELYEGDLSFQDSFDIYGIVEGRRTSHYYDYDREIVDGDQRDVILVAGVANDKSTVRNPRVFLYTDGKQRMETPQTIEDLVNNTFDHWALSTTFDLNTIRARLYSGR